MLFAALLGSARAQVFGCRHAETIPTLGQPASENLSENGHRRFSKNEAKNLNFGVFRPPGAQ